MRLRILTATALSLSSAGFAQELRLLHRVYHPQATELPFHTRGSVIISDANVQLQPSSTYLRDFAQFSKLLEGIDGSSESALYQLALELEHDQLLDLSSIRVCHLLNAEAEAIVLHTLESQRVPYDLDYFVTPIPHDGACPQHPSTSNPSAFFESFSKAESLGRVNVSISLRPARLPPSPELRALPPLTAQGETVQPPPEKSFLAKYGLYIGAVLVALLLTGGGPEEEPKGQAK